MNSIFVELLCICKKHKTVKMGKITNVTIVIFVKSVVCDFVIYCIDYKLLSCMQ